MKKLISVIVLIGAVLFIPAADSVAAGISVNFCVGTSDGTSVDAGETATQFYSVEGTNWNNVLLDSSVNSAVSFVANTTGGNVVSLKDDSGNANAAQLTSTFPVGGGNSKLSGITASSDTEGEAGMMASYLLMGGNFTVETFRISGLGSIFTANGYKVYLFFDIGTVLPTTSRALGYSVDDETASSVYWAEDAPGDGSDTNDDGVMEWVQAAGNSAGNATVGANYAVFTGLSASNFTVSITGASRGSLSGLQIVANDGPPPTIESFTASPETILSGGTSTLSWAVSGADSISISPDIGTVSASGSTNMILTSSAVYTLTAINENGVRIANADVTVDAGPVDVYLLGGQSNMQGKGDIIDIPAGQEIVTGVLYYHSSVTPGQTSPYVLYTNVTPTGASTSWFGPEMGFANRIKQLRPDVTMALLKYAVSGTSLAVDWDPGENSADTAHWGPQFSGFVYTITNGLHALRAAGYQPRIVGMLWQQGEADARSDGSSLLYESNLVHFISRVREQFIADISSNGMRFVQGTVLPYAPAGGTAETAYPGRDAVNTAKFNSDENSGSSSAVSNVSTVFCDDTITPTRKQILDDGDEVHLSAQAQLILGKLMAEHMQSLKFSDWSSANSLMEGPDGDDDGDGISNGLEFFLGTNPVTPDSSPGAPSGQPVLLDAGDGLQNYFVMSFHQDMLHNASGLSWQVDGSTNLMDWAGSAYESVLVDRVNHTDGTAIFRYRTARPVNSDSQSFLRLRLIFSTL